MVAYDTLIFFLMYLDCLLSFRKRDEELDAVMLAAQALVYNLKKLNGLNRHGNQVGVDNLQTASLLALFVSDHFGGSDRSAIVERTRKSVSGSNYNKPFVCTCSAGSSTSISSPTEPVANTIEDITLSKMSEKSLDSMKKRQNSIIIPIGSVQYGVCRHRALLFKVIIVFLVTYYCYYVHTIVLCCSFSVFVPYDLMLVDLFYSIYVITWSHQFLVSLSGVT